VAVLIPVGAEGSPTTLGTLGLGPSSAVVQCTHSCTGRPLSSRQNVSQLESLGEVIYNDSRCQR
jgi:hypothetical protein